MIREAMKDAVAEAGMTEEDIRERVRKLESPARGSVSGYVQSLFDHHEPSRHRATRVLNL